MGALDFLKRGKSKPQSIVDKLFESQARLEGGFSEIKGTHFTKFRIELNEKTLTEIINRKTTRLNALIKKKETPELIARIEKLDQEIDLWQFYRKFKSTAVAWSAAGEDRDASQSVRAVEILFFRNLHNSSMWGMLKMALEYVGDKCFKEWQVQNVPVIVVQAQGHGVRIGLDDALKSGTQETA